jgi:hypothetical protein
MMKTRTLDLFVTEKDYDVDETALGPAETAGASLVVTTTPQVLAQLITPCIVRFVSTTLVTDFIAVRTKTDTTFTVENTVNLPAAQNFTVHLVHKWIASPLKLTTRFQHVLQVVVMAYALVGISSASLWEDHEQWSVPPSQDYVGLEIKELPGRILSTNRFMQSMLAVLPTHSSSYHPSSWVEAKDSMIFLPEGLARTVYEQPVATVNSITPRLVDRRGDTVIAARFHLWLRLKVHEE